MLRKQVVEISSFGKKMKNCMVLPCSVGGFAEVSRGWWEPTAGGGVSVCPNPCELGAVRTTRNFFPL